MTRRRFDERTRIKTRLRVGDTVQVIAGGSSGKRELDPGEDERLRGTRGRLREVDHETGKAIVEGVNVVYKHQRRSNDPSQPNVGRIETEAPVQLSNLQLVCPHCDKPTRLRVRVEDRERDGRAKKVRVRVCGKCGEDIPERRS